MALSFERIRQTLTTIGLSQYQQAFEIQVIDDSVVSHLKESQFGAIGVALVGHRLTILRAFAVANEDAGWVQPGAFVWLDNTLAAAELQSLPGGLYQRSHR